MGGDDGDNGFKVAVMAVMEAVGVQTVVAVVDQHDRHSMLQLQNDQSQFTLKDTCEVRHHHNTSFCSTCTCVFVHLLFSQCAAPEHNSTKRECLARQNAAANVLAIQTLEHWSSSMHCSNCCIIFNDTAL